MTLASIVLCLILERWQMLWHTAKDRQWLVQYARVIQRHFKTAAIIGSWPGLVMIALPLMIVVALVQYTCNHVFYGVIGWIVNTVVLLYCIDAHRVHDAINRHWLKQAPADNMKVITTAGVSLTQFNREVFAVIFWFCIFGAFGALIYRAVTVWRDEAITSTSDLNGYFPLLTRILDVLDWIPARILALGLALMGDFTPTFHAWRQHFFAMPAANETLLDDCGKVALHKSADTAEECEWQEIALRSLLTWLVLFALVTLTALVP